MVIICSCTKITIEDIEEAFDAGYRTTLDIYEFLGKTPDCEECKQSIINEIEFLRKEVEDG